MTKVNILSIEPATHNVMHLKTEKPENIAFKPGQAVDVNLNKKEWEKELRPFTFTSLPTDNFLEFYIKVYPEHDGVTNQISKLTANDSISVGEVFGDIEYKGEGIFIAGGAGITPFIAILKQLNSQNKIGNNKLIFANNTSQDIIAKELLEGLLGKNFINVLSEEKTDQYEHGFITKELIEKNISGSNSYFYLCGPPPMMKAVEKQLKELGISESHIIKENF